MDERPSLAVGCPFCGAVARQRCRTSGGVVLPWVHGQRLRRDAERIALLAARARRRRAARQGASSPG